MFCFIVMRSIVMLCLAVMCVSGCRSFTQVSQKENGSPGYIKTAYQRIAAAYSTREAPGGLAPETIWTPNVGESKIRQDSFYAAARPPMPSDPNWTSRKQVEEIPHPTNANEDIASQATSVGSSAGVKESLAAEKKFTERSVEALPIQVSVFKDPWYFMATMFGTLFTCILAPVIVEMVKNRMVAARPAHK